MYKGNKKDKYNKDKTQIKQHSHPDQKCVIMYCHIPPVLAFSIAT